MPKSKEELQKQLMTYKDELKKYEGLLENARKKKNNADIVNYAMAVNGLKTSIKEIGAKLRSM